VKPSTKQVLLAAALAATVSGMALAAGVSEQSAAGVSEQRNMPATYGTEMTTLPGDQLTHPSTAQAAQPRQQGFHPIQAMRNAGDRLLHSQKTTSVPKEFNDNTGE